jgi:hypothetical protein
MKSAVIVVRRWFAPLPAIRPQTSLRPHQSSFIALFVTKQSLRHKNLSGEPAFGGSILIDFRPLLINQPKCTSNIVQSPWDVTWSVFEWSRIALTSPRHGPRSGIFVAASALTGEPLFNLTINKSNQSYICSCLALIAFEFERTIPPHRRF